MLGGKKLTVLSGGGFIFKGSVLEPREEFTHGNLQIAMVGEIQLVGVRDSFWIAGDSL
jgi:hypothetical protein